MEKQMVDRYEYHPRLGRMLHEEGYPPLFSVPTWMVKESDYMTLLRKYGQHTSDCMGYEGETCTCGFEAILDARSPASGEVKP
jgi:hypothetical protein